MVLILDSRVGKHDGTGIAVRMSFLDKKRFCAFLLRDAPRQLNSSNYRAEFLGLITSLADQAAELLRADILGELTSCYRRRKTLLDTIPARSLNWSFNVYWKALTRNYKSFTLGAKERCNY